MKTFEHSTTYTGRGENIAVRAFTEVVAGGDLSVEVFAKEGLELSLSVL